MHIHVKKQSWHKSKQKNTVSEVIGQTPQLQSDRNHRSSNFLVTSPLLLQRKVLLSRIFKLQYRIGNLPAHGQVVNDRATTTAQYIKPG